MNFRTNQQMIKRPLFAAVGVTPAQLLQVCACSPGVLVLHAEKAPGTLIVQTMHREPLSTAQTSNTNLFASEQTHCHVPACSVVCRFAMAWLVSLGFRILAAPVTWQGKSQAGTRVPAHIKNNQKCWSGLPLPERLQGTVWQLFSSSVDHKFKLVLAQ